MNTTAISHNEENPIFIYLLIAESMVNLLVTIYTAYKIENFMLKCNDLHICCFHCNDFELDVSDNESRSH